MASVFISKNQTQTRRAAMLLGEELKKTRLRIPHALCILLSGELGAGKTLFAAGLLRGLGYRGHVQSPTFVLMKRYPIRASQFSNVWHIDCYRIERAHELRALTFKSILSDPKNIIIIEWPERIKKHLPKEAVRISFHHESHDTRRIELAA